MYDARQIFDDVHPHVLGQLLGDRTESSDLANTAGLVNAAGLVLSVVGTLGLRTQLPLRIRDAGTDSTRFSFDGSHEVVGDGAVDVSPGELPVFDALRDRFRYAVGRPKMVRLDGEESYQEFRQGRREQLLSELGARLDRLEQQFSAHVADQHGGGRLQALEDKFEQHLVDEHQRQVVGVATEADSGGRPVDLGLPGTAGKACCWMDEDEVLVSARTPHGILTTGEALDDSFKAVVGCAEKVGCCGMEALVLGAVLSPAVAGRRLLGCLDTVAPAFEGESAGFVGVIEPQTSVDLAALMALLQRCQRGDRQSCKEALRLASSSASKLVREAAKRLTRGQREQAKS